VPLVGFAVRLKPSAATAAYDCEYSGYFQSGVTIGPLRNGAPCRSTVANDPLEGVQVRLVPRVVTATQTLSPGPALDPRSGRPTQAMPTKHSMASNPHKSNGAHKPAAAKRKRLPRATATSATRSATRGAHTHPARRHRARTTRRHSPRRP
jgi:hypothetical protein